jgi:hypothetical protein
MNCVGITLAIGCLLAPAAALAESPACSPMQSQYVALLRQAAPSGRGAAAPQLAAAEADAERGNCHRFLFFGPPESPACPSIQATIDRLQRQLDGDGSFGSSVDEQKASLHEALQENGCSIPSLLASDPGRTLCMRTCDGYYFPLSNHISSKQIKREAEACQAI